MESILELQQICYTYPRADHPALSDLSLRFGKGEKIAVLGNNGAGKSTLFGCCNGLLTPQQGKVLLHGEPVKKKSLNALRQAVGIVFQDADQQIIASTVLDEVAFGPLNLGLSKQQALQKTTETLAKLHLSDFADRAPHSLSGGEKKWVTIADALAMDAELLLFDEPTASLDPHHTAELETLLNTLHQSGLSLVVSTHDIDFAYRFADRILLLSGGKLIADGSPEEIFAQDALLAQAALRRPILWEVKNLLDAQNPEFPRDISAFAAWLADARLSKKEQQL